MESRALQKGVHYGISFENTNSADAFINLARELSRLEVEELLPLPYRVNDDPSSFATRLNALSIAGFQGVVAVSVLGINCTDDAFYACMNLRDAVSSSENTVVAIVSSERKAELAKALAIGGFNDLPAR